MPFSIILKFNIKTQFPVWEGLKTGWPWERQKCNRNKSFVWNFMFNFNKEINDFLCFFAFFSMLGLFFAVFFDRFPGNFRLVGQDYVPFSPYVKKMFENWSIQVRTSDCKVGIFENLQIFLKTSIDVKHRVTDSHSDGEARSCCLCGTAAAAAAAAAATE